LIYLTSFQKKKAEKAAEKAEKDAQSPESEKATKPKVKPMDEDDLAPHVRRPTNISHPVTRSNEYVRNTLNIDLK